MDDIRVYFLIVFGKEFHQEKSRKCTFSKEEVASLQLNEVAIDALVKSVVRGEIID